VKIRPLKRFLQDDYRSAPQWFFDFLGSLNQAVDTLNPALQNGLDLDNNMTAERQQVTVTHNVPITVRMRRIGTTPRLVRLGYAAGYVGTANVTAYKSDGGVTVTVFFLGTVPTTAVSVVLIFEP